MFDIFIKENYDEDTKRCLEGFNGMDPELNNNLLKAFNKFTKDVFHSSTLSLCVNHIGANQYCYIAKGISNRFIKEIYKVRGEDFTNKLLEEILMSNLDTLVNTIYDYTTKKMTFVSFEPKSSFEFFKITLEEK